MTSCTARNVGVHRQAVGARWLLCSIGKGALNTGATGPVLTIKALPATTETADDVSFADRLSKRDVDMTGSRSSFKPAKAWASAQGGDDRE